MKLAWIPLCAVLVACGGPKASSPTSPAAVAPAYPATRWVPANPTYAFAAPTFADALVGIRDGIAGIGVFADVSVDLVGLDIAKVIGVNALDATAVAALGVDLQGSIAAFSEDLAPTFVLRMAAPEAMQAFLDKQRERGLVSRSVIVDGVELFSAEVVRDELDVSWAFADGWMWIHFTPAFARSEGTAWFTNSRKPGSPGWARDWAWASAAAATTKGLVGFLAPRGFLERFVSRVPDAVACARLLEPVQRVGLTIEIDGNGMARGAFRLDLGAAASAVSAITLPVPDGFAAAAKNAPLVAHANLDVVAARAWAKPCLDSLHERLAIVDDLQATGVRGGRAFAHKIDIDEKEGIGVVSLDLSSARFLRAQLDQIPSRNTFESSRTFGPLAGKRLSIPFFLSVDYVLTDKLAFVGMGDGMLAKTIGNGGSTPGPLLALDLFPGGISPDTWRTLGELTSQGMVERVQQWREGHVSVTLDGSVLVVAASGTRR